MKELLEHIVKAIVNNPDQVVIEMKESVDFPGLEILTVKVADADKGVVIGRKGRTINAIRDIMTISAIRNNKRIKVLVDEDGREDRPQRTQSSQSDDSNASTEDMLNDEI